MLLKIFKTPIIIAFFSSIAIAAAIDATAGFARKVNPASALAIYSDDPVALAAQLQKSILSGIEATTLPSIGYVSRRSMHRQALNATALGQLALSFAYRNDPGAEALMGLAMKMSRRDIIVQLWQAQKSKEGGKIDDALYYFDLGMRTNSSGQAYFFPILTSDLESLDFREKFEPYLRSKPIWLNSFLSYAIANSRDPENIANMIISGGGLPDDKSFRDKESALLVQLLNKSGYQAVKSFYVSLKISASAEMLTSLKFSKISTDPRRLPVTWAILQSPIGESTFFDDVSTQSTYLKAVISPGQREIIARKLMFLPPGRYHSHLALGPSKMGQDASVYLTLTCLGRSKLQLIRQNELKMRTSFALIIIPVNCEAQYFDIWVYSGDNQDAAEIVVQSAELDALF